VAQTKTSVDTAWAVVRRLTADDRAWDRGRVAAYLEAAGGDMREMLFALYDAYEADRPRER
jgi:hypothetical protein